MRETKKIGHVPAEGLTVIKRARNPVQGHNMDEWVKVIVRCSPFMPGTNNGALLISPI